MIIKAGKLNNKGTKKRSLKSLPPFCLIAWFLCCLNPNQCCAPKTLSRMTCLIFQISAMVMARGSSAKNVSAQKLR